MKKQLQLTVIPAFLLFVSCSAIRHHPKQVPTGDLSDYEIILKIKNEEQLINSTRNFLSGFRPFNEWLPTSINDRFQFIRIRYKAISPDQLNLLLNGLHEMPGVRVMEIKLVTF